MAIPLQPTLGEIRNAVAARVNMSRSGTLPANMRPLLDQLITKGQRYIYIQFPWVRLETRIEVPLVDGVADYDVPDQYHEGSIHLLSVIAADDNADTTMRKREWQLLYDGDLAARNMHRVPGRPMNWRIINGAITLYPTPDANWVTLVIEGQTRENALVNDEDRVSVDGESLIDYASILLREHMQIGNTKQSRQDWYDNIMKMRGLYKPCQSYPIASRKADGPAYWDRPSSPMGYVPYTPDWSPW